MKGTIDRLFVNLLFDDLPDISIKYNNRIWSISYEITDHIFDVKRQEMGKVLEFIGNNGIRVLYSNGDKADIDFLYYIEKRKIFFISPNGNICWYQIKKVHKVNYLVHFTPIDNLLSIMNKGICPRSYLSNIRTTDEYRLDGLLDAISFSISFPNYRMLWKKKIEMPETKFIILLIDVDVLLGIERNNVAYCMHNAASSSMTNSSFFDKTRINAVEDMFNENEDKVREKYNLPSYYTTDPQAEVLIKDIIPPEFIKEIHVESPEDYHKVQALGIKNLPLINQNKSLFKPRIDYEYWR